MKELYWVGLFFAGGILGCDVENVDVTSHVKDTETSNEDTSLSEDTQTERYSSDDSDSAAASKSGECPLGTAYGAFKVSISGLEKPISMEPIQPGNRYFDTTLSHPPFAEGDELHLVSTEGFAGTLDLAATGVAPLTIADERWLVQQGSALLVNWNAGQLADAEVLLTFDVNQHGVSPLFVRCIFSDTGEGTVPQGLIDQLLTLDEIAVSGFPSGYLIRRTIDTSGMMPGYYVNVQLGEESLVKPPPGITTDQFILQYDMPGQPVAYIAHSSLVSSTDTVLSRGDILELGAALNEIHRFFKPAYGTGGPEEFYAMDVEFKFDGEPGETPKLFVKQARPYPGWGVAQ